MLTNFDRKGLPVSNLQVEYSTLESSAKRADSMAQDFASQLKQLESTVMAMVWKGQSGQAFTVYFERLQKEIAPVQQTLHQLASSIRTASSHLQQSDAAVAHGFNG